VLGVAVRDVTDDQIVEGASPEYAPSPTQRSLAGGNLGRLRTERLNDLQFWQELLDRIDGSDVAWTAATGDAVHGVHQAPPMRDHSGHSSTAPRPCRL
jgi:hypothetical protein